MTIGVVASSSTVRLVAAWFMLAVPLLQQAPPGLVAHAARLTAEPEWQQEEKLKRDDAPTPNAAIDTAARLIPSINPRERGPG